MPESRGSAACGMLRAAKRHLAASPSVSRRLLRNALVVFLWHEVSDDPSEFNQLFDLNVPPAVFSKQLDLIQESFHVIALSQLLRRDYPTPAALITFDDGNLSYFQQALPILREKGIPSIQLLNMASIRGDVCWSGLVSYLQHCEPGFYETRSSRPTRDDFCRFSESEVRRYLESVDTDQFMERVRRFRGPVATEADLQAVSNDPSVSLGNHLYNHYNATVLSDRLRDEYRKNQRILDNHPRGRRVFGYPFSAFNEQTQQVLREEEVQVVLIGGGFPNLRRDGHTFYRVELGPSVATRRALMVGVLQQYLSAWVRGTLPTGPA